MFHSPITVEEMFNRERVILTIEPQAILWYRRVVLYGSIGLPQAKFTKRIDSWRRAPTDQMMSFSATLFAKD